MNTFNPEPNNKPNGRFTGINVVYDHPALFSYGFMQVGKTPMSNATRDGFK